jgi:hypothetical protein
VSCLFSSSPAARIRSTAANSRIYSVTNSRCGVSGLTGRDVARAPFAFAWAKQKRRLNGDYRHAKGQGSHVCTSIISSFQLNEKEILGGRDVHQFFIHESVAGPILCGEAGPCHFSLAAQCGR